MIPNVYLQRWIQDTLKGIKGGAFCGKLRALNCCYKTLALSCQHGLTYDSDFIKRKEKLYAIEKYSAPKEEKTLKCRLKYFIIIMQPPTFM